eukprot:914501-Alexandrium_andersonii.AAC.1
MAPLACGPYAGGDSSTVCAPERSATARRKSANAGSLSDPSAAPEPANARRRLAHCVVAQSALAQHR